MNVISSTYFSAERQDGVCRGTLWRTNAIQDTGRTVDYCTVTANLLDCYESRTAWARGDFPLASLTVVGASAMEDDISFRLVTNQGSHLQCQATSKPCRNLWLAALLSGLELALQQAGNAAELTALTPPSPPSRRFAVRRADSYCRSCGANATPQKVVHATVAPLPQYGMEQRVALCRDCALAQGLWMHVQTYHWALQTAQHERIAFKQGRDLCFQVISAPENTTTTTATAVSTTTSIETTAEQATAAATTPSEDEDSSWTNVSGGSRSTPSPPDQWHTVEHSPSSSSNNNNWIDVPPTSATTKALWQVVKSRDFELYAQQSPLLHKLQQQFLQGLLGVNEFLAQLKAERDDAVELAALKQQAFRLAGDMGSALQLLLTTTSSTSADSIDLLVCILDFLLDLCAQGETAAVAFFWPQLCHLHLRMLPPETAAQVIRVDLMEDFLLTVAARYSIQLALELVWSHTADLEESLESSSVAEMNTACRKRRFAVLRFVCELESLLFDFDGGWGGGSVALGRMLSPTGHQVDLLKEQMQKIQELRLKQPARLSQSARLDLLSQDKRQLPPEEAADEKLRIAKNADYFSCHLIFTRRLSDIAEKLRFMDVNERAAALEEELSLLNASGTMGGDPLNKVRDHLLRVVRVPNTEGHVFRSKERTPVLLLMEVIDEGAEAEDTENELVPEEKDESDTARGADEAPASDVCESGSIPACSHPESEFDDFGDVRKSPKGKRVQFENVDGCEI